MQFVAQQQEGWGKLSESTVADFERRNSICLPLEYRSFLLQYHGRVPNPNFFWVVERDWGSNIEAFYGFGPDGFQLQQYFEHRASLGIAEDLMAIGDDGCLNLLCIGIDGSRTGQILYLDHEFMPGEVGHECFLASSFSEFLHRLRENPTN